jgi:flagellar biosynthesis protein
MRPRIPRSAKHKQAVALRYDADKDTAPIVSAKGQGVLAEKILQLARENNIPIREDRNLVQVLSLLDVDDEIPPQAYQAVATILAFIYKLNQNG